MEKILTICDIILPEFVYLVLSSHLNDKNINCCLYKCIYYKLFYFNLYYKILRVVFSITSFSIIKKNARQ